MIKAEVNKIETRKTIKRLRKLKHGSLRRLNRHTFSESEKKVNLNKTINKTEHITIYTNKFKGSSEAAMYNDMTTKWTT